MPIDPNSIVDYLRQKNVNSSLESRRRLWANYSSMRYSASAAQNTELLAALRKADQAPILELTSPLLHTPGANVQCRLLHSGPMTLQNDIAQTSSTVGSGLLNLGALSIKGTYLFVLQDNLIERMYTLVATEHPSGSLELKIVDGIVAHTTPPVVIVTSQSDKDLIKKFIQTLKDLEETPGSGEVDGFITKRLKIALQMESVAIISDGMTLIVVGVINPAGALGGAVVTTLQATGSLLSTFLDLAIQDLPSSFTTAEKDRLRLMLFWFDVALALPSVSGTFTNKRKICKVVNLIDLGVQVVAASKAVPISPKYEMSIGLTWDATIGQAKLFCDSVEASGGK